MNELFSSSTSNIPEPKKVGVWAEATKIEAREYIIPKKSPESSDDIPTLPDLDDFEDILENEVPHPIITDPKDVETANVLAEVGGGFGGAIDGVEAAFEVLKSYAPQVDTDAPDEVWTVDSLLSQLADEDKDM